jgi:hypothetical protein
MGFRSRITTAAITALQSSTNYSIEKTLALFLPYSPWQAENG